MLTLPVGIMESIGTAVGVAAGRITHMRGGAGIELQPVEPGEAEGPDIERGNGVDPYAPFAVRAALVNRDRRRNLAYRCSPPGIGPQCGQSAVEPKVFEA